jgi:antitoxin HicB
VKAKRRGTGDRMTKTKKNPYWGSTLDDFLDEEGIREAVKPEAVIRVMAWSSARK